MNQRISGNLKFDLSIIVFFLKIRDIREICGKKKPLIHNLIIRESVALLNKYIIFSALQSTPQFSQ